MHADALQYVDQVGIGVHPLETTGHQQALDDADAFGTDLRPGKQPVLSAHGNGAQGTLEVVGVDRHRGIGQEHLEAALARQRIAQGLRQGAAGQQIRALALAIAPGPEGLHHRRAVGAAVGELRLAGEPLLAHHRLVAVECPDQGQGLGAGGGLAVLGLLEVAATVAPATGVSHLRVVPGIGRIGLVAVTEQGRTERAEEGLHMVVGARGRIVEDDLVVLAVDRPEVGLAQLALALAPGLDRHLVDGQHATLQQMLGLGIDDGAQQIDGPPGPGREGAAAQLDAALQQALVLAIQRQVIAELVDQHPGEEADIGHALL